VLRALATDGVVTLRPLETRDAAVLIAGRDDEWSRWLGPGTNDPTPAACIIVKGEVVGWVDYDTDREWLEAGEVNIGYNVFADQRRRGYASRAVELLIGYLGRTTPYCTATLLINPENIGSLAVAAKLGCEPSGEIEGSRYFKRLIDREDK
jgi:RimJ/RimL family protein N-acetyltransferase